VRGGDGHLYADRRSPLARGVGWYKVRKLAGKHRRLLAGAGAFALLLTAVIIVSTWLVVRAMDAEQAAIRASLEPEVRREALEMLKRCR